MSSLPWLEFGWGPWVRPITGRTRADAVTEPYNFNALGADQHAGALHPLNKVRHEFRFVLPSGPVGSFEAY